MITHDVDQGSCDWWQLRAGMATASEFDRIITPKTEQPSGQIPKYLANKLAQWVQGGAPDAVESFTSHYMQQGTDAEPEARAAYKLHTGLDAVTVGFCERDDGIAGCSPDGLVGDDGGLELKCPALHTQIFYLLNNDNLLDAYKCQVHGCLWVTGRKWWEIASFHRSIPHVIARVRVKPDEFTERLGKAVTDFAGSLARAKKHLIDLGVEPLPVYEGTTQEDAAMAMFAP